MTKAILGVIAGLIIGTLGALAYSHYLNDERLAELQSELDAAKAQLAKDARDKQAMAKETASVSDQIDQLQATNDDLKKQLTNIKGTAPAASGAPVNPMALMGVVRGMFQGGAQSMQRMLVLQSRLHLTPDQAAAIKAAMDADNKARRELMMQMFRNNGSGAKTDGQPAPAVNTLDQTLAQVLTPEQQAAYKQVQTDEQTSRADTSATIQVDQMMPLLQLTDSQKDQVYNTIYQSQMSAPDPTSLMGNPNAMSVVAAQAQATQTALANVLTPDQMALYKQQAQLMPQFGGGGMGRFGGGGNGGGGAPPAPTPAPATTSGSPAAATTQ